MRTIITCVVFFFAYVVAAHADKLTLNLGADLYDGPPHFEVLVNGAVAFEGDVATADGQVFNFEINGAYPRTLGIAFTNDAAAPEPRKANEDRNLIIKSVQLGDKIWLGKDIPHGAGSGVRGDADLVLGIAQTVEVPLGTPDVTALGAAPAAVAPAPQEPKRFSGGNFGGRLYFIGDSLTAGTGASDASKNMPADVSNLFGPGGRRYQVIAIGGSASTRIKDEFLRDSPPVEKGDVTVIWIGRNNYDDPTAVLSDVAAIVAHLKNKHYIVLPILAGDYPTEQKGQPGAKAIATLNDQLRLKYDLHYVPIDANLSSADRFDHIHLNDLGYAKIARMVFTNLKIKAW